MEGRCTSKRRVAAMNENGEGDPLGVAIFLTPEQLTQVGIEPEATDVIEYYVEHGEIRLHGDSE